MLALNFNTFIGSRLSLQALQLEVRNQLVASLLELSRTSHAVDDADPVVQKVCIMTCDRQSCFAFCEHVHESAVLLQLPPTSQPQVVCASAAVLNILVC